MTARQAKISALIILGNMSGTGIYDDKVMEAVTELQTELKCRAARMQESEKRANKKKDSKKKSNE